jgi:hypothetical protein
MKSLTNTKLHKGITDQRLQITLPEVSNNRPYSCSSALDMNTISQHNKDDARVYSRIIAEAALFRSNAMDPLSFLPRYKLQSELTLDQKMGVIKVQAIQACDEAMHDVLLLGNLEQALKIVETKEEIKDSFTVQELPDGTDTTCLVKPTPKKQLFPADIWDMPNEKDQANITLSDKTNTVWMVSGKTTQPIKYHVEIPSNKKEEVHFKYGNTTPSMPIPSTAEEKRKGGTFRVTNNAQDDGWIAVLNTVNYKQVKVASKYKDLEKCHQEGVEQIKTWKKVVNRVSRKFTRLIDAENPMYTIMAARAGLLDIKEHDVPLYSVKTKIEDKSSKSTTIADYQQGNSKLKKPNKGVNSNKAFDNLINTNAEVIAKATGKDFNQARRQARKELVETAKEKKREKEAKLLQDELEAFNMAVQINGCTRNYGIIQGVYAIVTAPNHLEEMIEDNIPKTGCCMHYDLALQLRKAYNLKLTMHQYMDEMLECGWPVGIDPEKLGFSVPIDEFLQVSWALSSKALNRLAHALNGNTDFYDSDMTFNPVGGFITGVQVDQSAYVNVTNTTVKWRAAHGSIAMIGLSVPGLFII